MATRPSPTSNFLLVNASFFALGTCAWALANAIFAELPIIIGWTGDWTLASKIALCIALANLAPLLWSLLADLRNGIPILSSSLAIGIILAIGLGTSICFIVLDTSKAGPLLTLSTLTGIVGSMTLVLFFPHAHPFSVLDNGWSVASIQIGSAISSLALAIVAIIQQPGSETPRFSMEVYFGVLVGFFCFAFLGLAGTMVFHPHRRQGGSRGGARTRIDKAKATPEPGSEVFTDGPTVKDEEEQAVLKVVAEEQAKNDNDGKLRLDFWNVFLKIFLDRRFLEVNVVQFILNALTFFLPGVVPYSISHYPNSSLALHYQTVSQLIAQTIGILLTGFPAFRSDKISFQLLAAIVFWVPLTVLCFHNDLEPFHDKQSTSAVPIALYTTFMFLYGYTSTTCFQLVSLRCKQGDRGEHVSRVLGLLNQMGAMTGSIIGYIVVQNGLVN